MHRAAILFTVLNVTLLSAEATVTSATSASPCSSRISGISLTNNYGHRHYQTKSNLLPLAFKSSSWVRKRQDTSRDIDERRANKKNRLLSRSGDMSSRVKKAVENLLGFDRIIDSVFEDADTNHDGTISLSEVQTLILEMYVKINRAAPIPPPNREKINAIFDRADADKNNKLSQKEFSELASVLASRATTRLVAHKIVSFVVAPLLAIKTVDWLSGKELSRLAPNIFKDRMTDANIWKTALTVVFVKGLGDVVISSVTQVMDAFHLKKKSTSD